MTKTVEELAARVQVLEEQNEELRTQNQRLLEENERLRRGNQELRARLETLEAIVLQLTRYKKHSPVKPKVPHRSLTYAHVAPTGPRSQSSSVEPRQHKKASANAFCVDTALDVLCYWLDQYTKTLSL